MRMKNLGGEQMISNGTSRASGTEVNAFGWIPPPPPPPLPPLPPLLPLPSVFPISTRHIPEVESFVKPAISMTSKFLLVTHPPISASGRLSAPRNWNRAHGIQDDAFAVFSALGRAKPMATPASASMRSAEPITAIACGPTSPSAVSSRTPSGKAIAPSTKAQARQSCTRRGRFTR
jgi:hypothetical protein